jgi:hypothetical protein
VEAERSGEVAVYMRIHATEFCPIFRKVAIPGQSDGWGREGRAV